MHAWNGYQFCQSVCLSSTKTVYCSWVKQCYICSNNMTMYVCIPYRNQCSSVLCISCSFLFSITIVLISSTMKICGPQPHVHRKLYMSSHLGHTALEEHSLEGWIKPQPKMVTASKGCDTIYWHWSSMKHVFCEDLYSFMFHSLLHDILHKVYDKSNTCPDFAQVTTWRVSWTWASQLQLQLVKDWQPKLLKSTCSTDKACLEI